MPPHNLHTPPTVPLDELLAVVKAARALLGKIEDNAILAWAETKSERAKLRTALTNLDARN